MTCSDMSARTCKWFTWLWMASLLTATVGVSGQQIYCYCVGKTTFSIFTARDACVSHVAKPADDCCDTPVSRSKTCCDKAADTHPCTHSTTKVFQLKTEFTVQDKAVEKYCNPLPVFWPQVIPVLASPVISCASSPEIPSYAHPPPAPFGRMLCVRHGVFRC